MAAMICILMLKMRPWPECRAPFVAPMDINSLPFTFLGGLEMDAFSTLPLSPVRTRIVMACTHCRKRKIKCLTVGSSAEGPCERCTKRGLKCEFITVAGQRHEESPADTQLNKPRLEKLAAAAAAAPRQPERRPRDIRLPHPPAPHLYEPKFQGAGSPEVPREYNAHHSQLTESTIYPTPDLSQIYIRGTSGVGSLPPLTRFAAYPDQRCFRGCPAGYCTCAWEYRHVS
ncbi:hypothetical protein FB45DRAFT_1086359 [Roridomyces roridus]|uniref:Zn(2)-C6 fungal-type domain-containing protein n=1 Tax=Roridomyces roridus TaxID=1738132 RepID=A0AAD7BLN0_9AGAR|nr:hypothetical protein FB45DRAFT_1086359 [Roridomyces roridus]